MVAAHHIYYTEVSAQEKSVIFLFDLKGLFDSAFR